MNSIQRLRESTRSVRMPGNSSGNNAGKKFLDGVHVVNSPKSKRSWKFAKGRGFESLRANLMEKDPRLESVLAIARRLKALHNVGPIRGKYPLEFYKLKKQFKTIVGHEWEP